MIKLIVKLCLVLNSYICLPPIEVVPLEQTEITSVTSCLMGGAIYTVTQDHAEYYARVFCTQSPEDFNKWLETHKSN